MDRLIGKVIQQYEIIKTLGRGGMGVVYLAHDAALDRDVAFKTMDVLMASDPAFMKRFQSEARALARLNDPNIVTVFNLLETPDGVCIVMELVRGRTLGEILKDTPLLPVQRVIRIFRQVFAALDHAHNEGVIHRDIKPGNVMLTNNDLVKITDFGLAKIQKSTATTVTKGTAGTLIYMSPEQIRGLGQVDHRGDIYSAGMALYECLAGGLPFERDSSDYTIASMIVEGHIPPPQEINPALPKDLAKIVMTAIENDPARRYQTAGEVVSALDRFSGGGGTRELSTRSVRTMEIPAQIPPTAPVRPWRRLRWPAYAGGAGVVVILGVLYAALRPSNPTSVGGQEVQAVSPAPLSTAGAAEEKKVPPSAAPVAEARVTLIAIPEGEAAVDSGSFQSAGKSVTLGVFPGTRKFRFRSAGGISREKSVTVHAGEPSTIRCYFQGEVQVEATLDYISAPAAIVVDGALRRETAPGKVTLSAGKHRVGVRIENYVSIPENESVSIEPSFDSPKTYKVTFRMKREQ